jgi:methionyl-tRNA synthetase
MSKSRQILVTTALPYANGQMHLGYIVEAVQADIWVRFQRLMGNQTFFVCGNDAHGTPIMISAEKQGISPEALIQEIHGQHEADLKDFMISLDEFYTTHSPENKELSAVIYQRLYDRGDISQKTIQQAFDPVKNMFLPDRYVKGECPRCGAKDQYGDNCEVCGATYTPTELKNPVSAISGATPIQKESVHYFFQLDHYEDFLKQWTMSGHLQTEVSNKLDEWFKMGLEPWDISRDSPYFGFEIPNAPGKYFYVWLDAPIGYMASFKQFCSKRDDLKFDEFWSSNSDTELYHFVGKDIVYFHALFWPAMLKGSDFRLPNAIFTHGFLTINGQKMSKSRGTFITARNYLNHLDPEYLRYYFAAKLNSRVEDIDINFSDFLQRINSDLVGKVINIASRCSGFITKQFEGVLADTQDNPDLWQIFVNAGDKIAKHYVERDYHHAVREIMALADLANQYIDEKKPWVLAKQIENAELVQRCCTQGLNFFKIIMTYLQPILPKTAKATEELFKLEELSWSERGTPLLNKKIEAFKPMMSRIQNEVIESLLNVKEHIA